MMPDFAKKFIERNLDPEFSKTIFPNTQLPIIQPTTLLQHSNVQPPDPQLPDTQNLDGEHNDIPYLSPFANSLIAYVQPTDVQPTNVQPTNAKLWHTRSFKAKLLKLKNQHHQKSKTKVNNEAATTFHRFGELPSEVQIRIWEFAATPRLVWLEVDLLEEALYYKRQSTLDFIWSRMLHTSLLQATYESRKVAATAMQHSTSNLHPTTQLVVESFYDYDNLQFYGKERRNYTMRPTESRRFWKLDFNSERDYLFLSHTGELESFVRLFNARVDSILYPTVSSSTGGPRFQGIRRIVMGPCLKPFSLLSALLITQPYRNFFRYDFQGLLFEGFGQFLAEFGDLEELVWVVAEKKERILWKKLEINFEALGDILTKSREKIIKGRPGVQLSAWWSAPKVTVLSEEEFQDRFPQAKTFNYPSTSKKCSKRIDQDPLIKQARLWGLAEPNIGRGKINIRSARTILTTRHRPVLYRKEFRKPKYLRPEPRPGTMPSLGITGVPRSTIKRFHKTPAEVTRAKADEERKKWMQERDRRLKLRKRKFVVTQPDSDFVAPGSSDNLTPDMYLGYRPLR